MPFDITKEYGIVLEGGGARGAYQIGVWKALRECGIQIKGVVGTSVGALNGALICGDFFDEALEVWENIRYSQVIEINDHLMENILKLDIKEILKNKKDVGKLLLDGGLNIGPLKQLINKILDEDKLRKSGKDFGLVTVSLSDMKPIEIFLEDIPQNFVKDYLLASAYLPVFKSEKLNGKLYLDGGIHNNVPISMLLNKGYKDIIVVRIFGFGRGPKVKIEEGINVIEISPKESIGGLLDFDSKRSRRNIQLGYYDTLKALNDLKGSKYYIEQLRSERYYMHQMINIEEDTMLALAEYFGGLDASNRSLLEKIYPAIAKEIGLHKKWNYQELFMRLLELLAIKYKLPRFKVYSSDELLLKLKLRIIDKTEMNLSPLFKLLAKIIIEI